MRKDSPVYMGPRLRRLRRDLGLTQADMAADLDISPSYVALLERNQRPLTADMLLRLARTYKLDMAEVAGDGGTEQTARLHAVLKDPMFADLDLPALATGDVAVNYPGITEALLRLYTSYREEHLALADQGVAPDDAPDPVAESRRFLAARRNSFPMLDDMAEKLAADAETEGGLTGWLRARHSLRVRRLPSDVMAGSLRRYDRHRDAILLDDTLDTASAQFQIALQIAYLEMRKVFDAILKDGQFTTESSRSLARRALANYGAAAILMPYAAFAKAVEARRYDVEALARQFGTSFEQTAHRLTTLQKPGQERVPFFFLRVDPAGNVSKRLDSAGFPFARHGGSCPLWSVHRVFETPRQLVTQWLELPDGQRFFSIARTVTAGGGGWGAPRVDRAIALCCAADHAHRLIYTQGSPPPDPTPIGVTCRLCHRPHCLARAAPPIGRDMLPDDYRGTRAPFGFADG
ncbi:putative transcriptional regulator/transcriptional regulator with XRE-family HTH domain [Sphingobium xenophagum]|uniref:Transcriptional regulator/transcriptional regulator with XRE-family HTH domain n=1 Tax=Sphingobium xenophagum TaxID=121428 RepID=A0ABU1WW53_SPHXE|nr:short-chain fatty acyl-CoA regulator family protein [Sphingobium xenophagum]MDR7153520.1 putative transcriptional regulator/transcriptional regulator with XRE-family HTH domain [Sphingobium xenophagum]